MKSAKAPHTDAPASRRSQPVRQARANPLRASRLFNRSAGGASAPPSASLSDQPIDIFPAITHFADTITALPKELVRHFTLLREVDAKLFGPEEQLFRLVAAATNAPAPALISQARPHHSPSTAPTPPTSKLIPWSAMTHGSTSDETTAAAKTTSLTNGPKSSTHNVFDPSNYRRRKLFHQTAFKIQEMLVSLEEKNHVISTANEALQRQLARIEDVWPYLENEFSDEAKWGSSTHWAYPENRYSKPSHAERARRDGAAAISAAAQALADEAAARSDARKQAVQAKRNQRTQHHDSDADDLTGRNKAESGKRSHASKSWKVPESGLGLGISGASSTNGNPPPKRRKVEKTVNGGEAMERSLSGVLAQSAQVKARTNSPRETPVPDGPRKRKALSSGSSQLKKKNGASGLSPSVTSSPILGVLPELKAHTRASPAPGNAPRPGTSRARRSSLQSNTGNGRTKGSTLAMGKTNGNTSHTPSDLAATSNMPRATRETDMVDEDCAAGDAAPKAAPHPRESDLMDIDNGLANTAARSESATAAAAFAAGADDVGRRSGSGSPHAAHVHTGQVPVTTMKSGRASKPSTPALASFQEAARPRSSRNADNSGASNGKRSHNKGAPAVQALVPRFTDDDTASSMQGEEEERGVEGDGEAELDADEPTYCYCNSVSYGEMVACDADGCEREWFHLACVGLKVAPGSKTKWFCEDCKERLKGSKKITAR